MGREILYKLTKGRISLFFDHASSPRHRKIFCELMVWSAELILSILSAVLKTINLFYYS